MTRRAWGAAALVAAGLAAGCGGGDDRLSQGEYEDRVADVGTDLEESFDDLSGTFEQGEGASLDEAADQIGQIQESMRERADELDDLEPPEDVQEAHDKLVEGLNGFADDLDEFRQAVDEGDVQAIQQFATEFQQSDAAQEDPGGGPGTRGEGLRHRELEARRPRQPSGSRSAPETAGAGSSGALGAACRR